MRRSILAEPVPDNAETYKKLRFVCSETAGQFYCKAWRGRSQKPFAYYRFPSEERRNAWIAEQKASEDSSEKYAQTRKQDKQAGIEKMTSAIQVGTILHYSWGYEQTQCEYFQVIAKAGRKVTIRQIASQSVPGSEYSHGMADMRTPCPDQFLSNEAPMTKIIGEGGIAMSFGTASPCSPDDKNYCSWYA